MEEKDISSVKSISDIASVFLSDFNATEEDDDMEIIGDEDSYSEEEDDDDDDELSNDIQIEESEEETDFSDIFTDF